MNQKPLIILSTVFLLASAAWLGYARADDSSTAVTVDDPGVAGQINGLSTEINAKRSDAADINGRIAVYQKKIDAAQSQAASLANDVDLLANRVAKSELDIQATDDDIAAANDEIQLLQARMDAVQSQLTNDRASLSGILEKLDVYDNDMTLQLLFGSDSFGELFDRLTQLSTVTGDLQHALTRAEAEREQVSQDRADQVGKKQKLLALQTQQEQQKALLEDEQGSKEQLLAQSKNSEAQFKIFVNSLSAEQQYVNQEIVALQDTIEQKLSDADQSGQGASVITWPVEPLKGISTLFHDPTYPFRHLFEHPGIDIPTPKGTPVKSAAPGYVAWTKTGTQYGNYVMVIHSGGLATLYAHLSRFNVVQDQFVARGDVIGYSGGVPGDQGAGLSTGAHLHFEVRKDGIPTDPLNYLPSL